MVEQLSARKLVATTKLESLQYVADTVAWCTSANVPLLCRMFGLGPTCTQFTLVPAVEQQHAGCALSLETVYVLDSELNLMQVERATS